MMRIEIRTFGGQPPPAPVVAEFDEMGGSIGRSEGNTLILPDEKRYISRSQATIAFRSGGYVLRDLGSATPTVVNGAAVGNGNEVALHGGDEIRIGDYVLAVSAASASAPAAAPITDPFADLLPQQPPHGAAPQARPAVPSPRLNAFDDPFAMPAARESPTPPAQAGVIPQDFDPFADLLPQPPAGAPSTPSADLGLSQPADQNLDALFGLKAGSNWDPLGGDSPLPEMPAPGAPGLDPLAALSQPPQHVPVQRDDAPMLSGAFRLPQPKSGQAAPADHEPVLPVPPARALPDDVFVSWAEPSSGGIIKSVVLPASRRTPAADDADTFPQAPDPAPAPAAAPMSPAARPIPAPAPAAQVRQAADPDALLDAFLQGAGVPGLDIPRGMSPELMKLVGELMREAIRGTLELLLARALTKREVRAQATVIIARENNPLKFSPTVEAALTHLLATQGQGFMPPAAAVRDAYNDLRSHQFGFMAGMRAALEGVLARFDPARLEQRVSEKAGMFGGAATRKAKLWELYEQLYRDISREAEDDFHTLFGREFLRAYEAQIEKLEREDTAGGR